MSFIDEVREALRQLRSAGPRPHSGPSLAAMRETLIQARVGLSELRDGADQAERRLAREQAELETVRRRGRMATEIGDAETAAVAARFESQHAERVAALEARLVAQKGELAVAEREIAEMTAELKRAAAGIPQGRPGVSGAASPSEDAPDPGALASELDSLARTRERDARAAAADERLADLKRRMGR